MKKLLLPACILLLAACNNKTAYKDPVMDIFTITDNGKAYADTVVYARGGIVVPPPADCAKGMITEDTTTVEGSTSHFTRATDKEAAQKDCPGCDFYCNLHKTKTGTNFSMLFNLPSGHVPATVFIINAAGPANGTGVYKIKGGSKEKAAATDSSTMALTNADPTCSYTERSGQAYTVDSGTVSITKADHHAITGTYQLWVTGAAGSKVVTGTISNNTVQED